MAAMGGKRTLANAIDYPPTDPLGIFLAATVTLGAYHADAIRNLNRAFYPIASVGL